MHVLVRPSFGTLRGLAKREVKPIFDGDQVTLQSLFMCQQVFSAALIGMVECKYADEAKKNLLCQPVPHPEVSRDFVAAIRTSLSNSQQWGRAFGFWLLGSRLFALHHESIFKVIWNGIKAARIMPAAVERMDAIHAQELTTEP